MLHLRHHTEVHIQDHMIHLEITSLDNLLWIVVKYQDVQKHAKGARMEKYLSFQDDLLRKNVGIQEDLL